MAICFFVNFVVVAPDFGDLMFGTFVPTIPEGTSGQAIGLIGAVIMPHNLYLHSSLVQSRKINAKSAKQVHEANVYNSIESGISLFIKANNVSEDLLRSLFSANVSDAKILSIDVKTKCGKTNLFLIF